MHSGRDVIEGEVAEARGFGVLSNEKAAHAHSEFLACANGSAPHNRILSFSSRISQLARRGSGWPACNPLAIQFKLIVVSQRVEKVQRTKRLGLSPWRGRLELFSAASKL